MRGLSTIICVRSPSRHFWDCKFDKLKSLRSICAARWHRLHGNQRCLFPWSREPVCSASWMNIDRYSMFFEPPSFRSFPTRNFFPIYRCTIASLHLIERPPFFAWLQLFKTWFDDIFLHILEHRHWRQHCPRLQKIHRPHLLSPKFFPASAIVAFASAFATFVPASAVLTFPCALANADLATAVLALALNSAFPSATIASVATNFASVDSFQSLRRVIRSSFDLFSSSTILSKWWSCWKGPSDGLLHY